MFSFILQAYLSVSIYNVILANRNESGCNDINSSNINNKINDYFIPPFTLQSLTARTFSVWNLITCIWHDFTFFDMNKKKQMYYIKRYNQEWVDVLYRMDSNGNIYVQWMVCLTYKIKTNTNIEYTVLHLLTNSDVQFMNILRIKVWVTRVICMFECNNIIMEWKL